MKIKNNIMNWLADDWKNNRFRMFCETIGSLGFISIYVLMAWYGDSVSIATIFGIQIIRIIKQYGAEQDNGKKL